jgi:hypothetical protein
VTGDDRGINVQRRLPECADLAEEPATDFGPRPFVAPHVEAGELPRDSISKRLFQK